MAYFFVAISTRENLKICKRYALAGFTNNINGVWAFSDITEGDFISFLYGAKAHNLYQVKEKEAIKDAEKLPPWKPLTFKESGKTYYFPFRLYLEPIRKFEESVVRSEFAYIAENLLLRGGYRKTHFQADQTTLQNASQMGEIYREEADTLDMPSYETFTPRFIRSRKVNPPEIFQFREIILQSLLRQHLSQKKKLKELFEVLGLNFNPEEFEILGEKALPEGHLDILIKDSNPVGRSRKIVIEVKLNNVSQEDIKQLKNYMRELGEECIAGVMISDRISKKIHSPDIHFLRHTFDANLKKPCTFEELLDSIAITKH
jgi:hypothetical protein